MNERVPITVLILTYNEEANIGSCLESVQGWADQVLILDSGSTDRTVELVKEAGVQVFYRKFDNYAAQRNYAVQELPVDHDWILFLDADEVVTPESRREMAGRVSDRAAAEVGYFVRLKFIFMGHWIKHGGYNSVWKLVLFRKSALATIEREIDEHVVVNGSVMYLRHYILHEDQKHVGFWYVKHSQYAIRYADVELKEKSLLRETSASIISKRERKRWIREQVWNRIPVFIRPFLYFVLRYFFQLGFLDGRVGFVFHFSHAFLYHFIIAAVYTDKVRLLKKVITDRHIP